MRAIVNRSAVIRPVLGWTFALCWTFGLWLALAASASAAEGQRVGAERWIPSLALVSGITFQNQSATAAGVRCPATQAMCPPTATPLTLAGDPLSDSGSGWVVSPYVGGNLQLATPEIPRVAGARLFINGEVLPTFSADYNLAKVSNPTTFQFPGGNTVPADAIGGQGIVTRASVNTWVFGAAIGMAFPFEFEGRQLWVKPSFGWLRYQVEVRGKLLRAFCRPAGPTTQCLSPMGSTDGYARLLELQDSDSQWYDGIGPGLELEMEVGTFGPIGATLFADTHAYAILGDRNLAFSESVTISDGLDDVLGAQTYTGFWSFEPDPWIFRAGLGVRFQWLGGRR